MKRTIFILFIVLASQLMFTGNVTAETKFHPEKPREFKRSETLPGGIHVNFTLITLAKYRKEVDKTFDYTFTETKKIASLFDTSNAKSDISRINKNVDKKPTKVTREVLILTKKAKKIAKWTGGAFDPVKGDGIYKNLKIDEKDQTVYLSKQNSNLDLKGILEGFIADLFIRAAYHSEIKDAFVEVNGVKRALGKPFFGPWQIIISGKGDKKAISGVSINLSNFALATVGGITHPLPGVNAHPDIYSVTVVTKEAATAQGVASAIYAMGPKRGEALIKTLGIRAVFALNNGEMKKIGDWE